MNAIRCGVVAVAALLLGGCVGYGYQGSGYGGGHSGGGPGSGGYRPPSNGGYPGYGNGGSLRCESNDNRQQRCSANTRGGVRLVRQLSDNNCIQGRTWGYDNSGIWVTQGCRAEFAVGSGGGGPGYGPGPGNGPGYGQTLRCESNDNRQKRCDASIRSGATLVRQLSDTRCVQGRNWGWDRSGIWVSGGCRGEFSVR